MRKLAKLINASVFKKKPGNSAPYLCVNCWGIQEYDGITLDKHYSRDKDFSNHNKQPTFIERL